MQSRLQACTPVTSQNSHGWLQQRGLKRCAALRCATHRAFTRERLWKVFREPTASTDSHGVRQLVLLLMLRRRPHKRADDVCNMPYWNRKVLDGTQKHIARRLRIRSTHLNLPEESRWVTPLHTWWVNSPWVTWDDSRFSLSNLNQKQRCPRTLSSQSERKIPRS